MATNSDILGFLDELGLKHSDLQEGMWLVTDASGRIDIVVHHDPPLVVFRVKMMDLPDRPSNEDLFRELLELNATEMIHGAYALEGNSVVAVDALQSETLDVAELQGSIDSLSLAATTHLPRLARFFQAE